MPDQNPPSPQEHQNCKQAIDYYKDLSKRLQQKVSQYEKRLTECQKHQQKIRALKKENEENSARLLQCVSNIRDLLHSNKMLREELNREKRTNQGYCQKVFQLQLQLKKQAIASNPINFNNNQPRPQSSLAQLKSNKQLNLRKLKKLQKLSRFNSVSEKRHSLTNLQSPQLQSTLQKTKIKLRLITQRFRSTSFVINEEPSNKQRKNMKLCKSLEVQKRQQKKYLKAQLRRKKSMYDSDGRMEMLQHKPYIQQEQ